MTSSSEKHPDTAPPSIITIHPGLAWSLWLGITLLACAMRLSNLEHLPNGLFRDEAEKGYNAYALATSGGVLEFPVVEGRASTRWRSWPLVIDVAGAKTSAVYQYASAPIVKVLGLSVASTRMAAAATGTITIAAVGALLLFVWPPSHALGAMLWLALCPWHYVFSRWALQGIFVPLGMAFVLGGLVGVDRRRWWGFPLASAALGFIFYSYSGAQPFVLLWALALLILYRSTIPAQRWPFLAGLALFLLAALPRVWAILTADGAARLDAVAVWNAADATPLLTMGRIALNYVAHFNPVYLFLSGDALPRHAIPDRGQLLLIDALLLPVGLWVTYKRNFPLAKPLLLAFLLGPVGAAITREGIPHALRSIPMLLPAAIWGGVGLVAVSERLRAMIARSNGNDKNNSNQSTSAWLVASLTIGASLLWAAGVYRTYRIEFSENAEVLRHFESGERTAFEELFEKRQEGQRVWIDAVGIAYAQYFVLFHGQLPAKETGERGLEAQGFFFFDPSSNALTDLARPGDWIIARSRESGEVTLRQL